MDARVSDMGFEEDDDISFDGFDGLFGLFDLADLTAFNDCFESAPDLLRPLR